MSDARVGQTAFALLGILAEGPATGYDIRRRIERSIRFFWSESYGQIYPTLRRLAEQGWIERGDDQGGSDSGRPRKTYQITAKGREALARWLKTPPEPESPRNSLLLRLFFAAHTEPAVLAGHLARHRRSIEAELDELVQLERFLETEAREDHRYHSWRATLAYGLETARAELRWLDQVEPWFQKSDALQPPAGGQAAPRGGKP